MTICVGQQPRQKEFVVHKSFISRSEFFRRALNGNWAESDDRTINLLEDDPNVFAQYLHFIYTNKFPTKENGATVPEMARGEYVDLAKIYVLAERLQDTPTKNAVMKRIFTKSMKAEADGKTYVPSGKVVRIIYEGTPKGNPIRSLVVDAWTTVTTPDLNREFDDIPKEFLRAIAIVWRSERPIMKGNNAVANGFETYLEK